MPKFSRNSAALLSILLLCLGFGLLADEMREGETLAFDQAILQALQTSDGGTMHLIGPVWFQEAARDVTALGSFTVLFPLVAFIAIYLLLEGKPRNAWALVLSSASGAILSTILKSFFDRPRPDIVSATHVFTSSFPSGHALSSAVIYLTIGTFLARAAPSRSLARYGLAVAAFLTVIVGLSRIYLGVHYPTDVLAGWMIGLSWAIVCWLVAEWLFPSNPKA
ncbi:phosphatase PAP2 family protein [Aestuariivirga litoralis]|uniref:phosphatase PAP2 family protein n=1 Tax=Aestuariivirga litoralis TaxID=2650924 RepID=UPI0018C474A5|nr:phosphatase PAP2 family protein [Aestuariivirga litoralis]MBG1231747.1 phosphatase PAP2 family protein [Aestuariivirga litoralis]